MTLNPSLENAAPQPPLSHLRPASAWYRPTFSHEHGVYVMLFVSFLTGAAAAQQWTLATTLALICSFTGFQAEHPFVLQIKQRRSWKPRFLIWGSIYAGVSLGIAADLYLQAPVLLWIYSGAVAALAIDVISVFHRQQRSVANELLTFAAVCLAAPFAYIATVGTWTVSVWGLWFLNTLFFSSAIFTVKLRKPKTASLTPGFIYHAVASLMITMLWYGGWIAPMTAMTYGISLFKLGFILLRKEWYQTTKIQNVALLETFSALVFFTTVALTLLPAHLK